MKPADPPPIFREWLSRDPAPAYLLYGDGAGLAGLLARSWEGKLRGEGVPIESFRWTLEDLARESPTAAWRSPSFFSGADAQYTEANRRAAFEEVAHRMAVRMSQILRVLL